MSAYKPDATNDESISKFNSEFIVYQNRSPEDKTFIDEVAGWGVEKWGPCFGIPEGNCRE